MAANFYTDVSGALKKIEEKQKALGDGVRTALATAMTDARDEIIERTQSGIDVDGRNFRPYSAGYAKIKNDLGGDTGTPNLTLGVRLSKKSPPTGMLRSIQVKVVKKGSAFIGTLFFPASQHGKVRGNQKIRRFFDLSKKQFESIKQRVRGAINGRR